MSEENKEFNLIQEAVTDPKARLGLFKYVRPTAIKHIKEYIQKSGIDIKREKELIDVGLSCFDYVFNIYMKNNRQLESSEEGHFSKYFNWWIRQRITDYLAEENN